MAVEVLKKFGKYFLLDQIAQGGMAEINRARLASADGAGRILVIKRIQAGFDGNREFQQMFESEIKVTMGFNHPNVVQLFDYGTEDGQAFIAMELVDGKNLRQFLSRFAELKQTFPVALAVHIIQQAASGLNYAHQFRDKITNEPLNIVHRDVSPQNILVSYDGNVKVIDFGIAKAESNSERTQAGVIKGKLTYLSPEQATGGALDARSDQFALGIVLWELLVGKKLFSGESDLAVLKQIEACNSHIKRPSEYNKQVPEELDAVVMKMLSKHRDDRYRDCGEVQKALHELLYRHDPDGISENLRKIKGFNTSEVPEMIKKLFLKELVEEQKKFKSLCEKAAKLIASYVEEPARSSDRGSSGRGAGVAPAPIEKKSSMTQMIELNKNIGQERVEIEIAKPSPSSSASRPVAGGQTGPRPRPSGSASIPGASRSSASRSIAQIPEERRSADPGAGTPWLRTLAIGAAAVLAVAFFGPEYGIKVPVLSDLAQSMSGSSSEARLTLEGNARDVMVTVNGKKVADQLPYVVSGVPVGSPFQVEVSGVGGRFAQEFTLKKGERRSVPVSFGERSTASVNQAPPALPGAEPGKSVLMRINVSPSGGRNHIEVDSRPLDPENPLILVPLDSSLELVVDRPGYKKHQQWFSLESARMSQSVGSNKEWPIEVQLEPSGKFGLLTIRSSPSAIVKIDIDGSPWVRRTPLEGEKIPVGTYSITLENEAGLKATLKNVQIVEGRVSLHDIPTTSPWDSPTAGN